MTTSASQQTDNTKFLQRVFVALLMLAGYGTLNWIFSGSFSLRFDVVIAVVFVIAYSHIVEPLNLSKRLYWGGLLLGGSIIWVLLPLAGIDAIVVTTLDAS